MPPGREILPENEGDSEGESSIELSQLFTRNKSLKFIIGKNEFYRPHRTSRDQARDIKSKSMFARQWAYILIVNFNDCSESNGLDAKMQVDKGEDKALEVLYQVEKDSEPTGILSLLYFCVWTDFACLKTHLFAANAYHKFLLTDLIRFWPLLILALQNTAVQYYAPHLIDHSLWDKC